MANRIVVLDGHTLNPGDLAWQPFEAMGPITVYDRTPADQIVARAAATPCLLTNKTPLSAKTIDHLPKLKYIGVLATGYNVVDLKAASRQNIIVTNVPSYGTDSVAQHATALMLELTRHVCLHNQAVHAGQWTTNPDWCFAVAPITELTGKTLGVVGLGRIGMALARIAAAMGMHLMAYSPRPLDAKPL